MTGADLARSGCALPILKVESTEFVNGSDGECMSKKLACLMGCQVFSVLAISQCLVNSSILRICTHFPLPGAVSPCPCHCTN